MTKHRSVSDRLSEKARVGPQKSVIRPVNRNRSSVKVFPKDGSVIRSNYTTKQRFVLANVRDESRVVSRYILQNVTSYRSLRQLRSIFDIASPKYSVMRLATNDKQFRVGDVIKVHIQLRNGRNEPMTSGGDMLRIWMSDKTSRSNFCGYVIDHGNGSYTGVLRALFPGQPVIKVSIAQTKEHIGIYLDYVKKEGIWYFMSAYFGKGKTTDETYCSTIPKFTWVRETCNFTDVNFGMSWYCGRPRNANLTCGDWLAYSAGKANVILSKNTTMKKLYR